MKNRKNAALIVAVAAMLTGQSAAAGESYTCNLKRSSQRGPVPLTIQVTMVSDGYEALVQDKYTKQLSATGVRGEVPSSYPNKTTIKWKLRGISFLGEENRRIESGVADYQLSINKTTERARLSVSTREHKGKYYGEGKCSRR